MSNVTAPTPAAVTPAERTKALLQAAGKMTLTSKAKSPKKAKSATPVLAKQPTSELNVNTLVDKLAESQTAAPKAEPVAFVKDQPITNYVCVDMNGKLLTTKINGVEHTSVVERELLRGTVYGPSFTKDDLFVCTALNTEEAVNRALVSIRGRWNATPATKNRPADKYRSPATAWVTVPNLKDRA